ncbi:uncharacterized protein LOC135924069 [Gordionus sp. m RMFG-2023]|uniref:uncharacterized protein LOC135924069 n=1 Tax=Gordionus sp. m RMFG-2023 TaxID=3053472 RepID=UPI0031FCB11D
MTNELEGKESLNSLSPLDSTLSTSKDSGLIKENPDVQKAIITLAETHVLNYNDSLNQLFASDQDANPNPSTLRDSNYLLRRLNKTLKQSSTALILKGRSTEFQEAIQYSTNFRDICRRLDKVGEHIWSEFTSYNKIQRSYIAFQDSTWLNFEISLTDLIKRETQCNSRLAQTLDEWLPRYKNSHLFIKNYALYYDSLREGMCNRDEFQVELELTKDEYEARKREIAKKMGNYARNQRLKDLLSGLNFKTLLNKCDNCDNNVSNNNTDSKADSNDGICKESAEYKNGVKSINMGHDKLSGDKNIDALRAAERDSMILKDFNRARSQMHMSALEREIERNQLASAKADSQFLEDFKVFRCNLVKDMKAYFVDLADLYIDLYSQNVKAWKACVEEEAAHSILNKN